MTQTLTAAFFVEWAKASIRVEIAPLARALTAAGIQEVSFHCFIQRIWRIR